MHNQHGIVSRTQHTPGKCQVDDDDADGEGDEEGGGEMFMLCLARGRFVVIIVSVLFSYNRLMVWEPGMVPSVEQLLIKKM